jgi:hypothetical protein
MHPSMCIKMGWSSPITKHDYTYNVLIVSHNQTWLHMTLCLFLVIVFSHAHNHTKKIIHLDYMKRLNNFFQDETFGHKVAFKHLYKGLQPFTNIGLHRKGVQLPNDDKWGACLPYFIKRLIFFQNNYQTIRSIWNILIIFYFHSGMLKIN